MALGGQDKPGLPEGHMMPGFPLRRREGGGEGEGIHYCGSTSSISKLIFVKNVGLVFGMGRGSVDKSYCKRHFRLLFGSYI